MPYCGQLQKRLPETGAALAYYSVFSLGPIIVIAIAVAGFFFGRDAVSGQVASSTKDMLGGHRCTSHSSHVSGCRSAQRVQNRDSAPASERRRAAPGPPFFLSSFDLFEDRAFARLNQICSVVALDISILAQRW
jgi:hypothetical protein